MRYFKNPNNEVFGYDADQQELIDEALAEGWTEITGSWPPPPSPEDLLSLCKGQAQALLLQTDWSQNLDVRPILINATDFDSYRATVRNILLNPVEHPIFPDAPKAEWK